MWSGTPLFPPSASTMSGRVDALYFFLLTVAVFFSLLSGRFVHEAESSQAIVVQCATEPARSLRDAWPGAPREIVQLIDSALAFKKASRWANATAMRKSLRAEKLTPAAQLSGMPSRSALP